MAVAGVTSNVGDRLGSVNVPINELRRGFVRILRGTSSRIDEKVRRC